MITRAQAEALLTLAESLEACERIGVRPYEDDDGLRVMAAGEVQYHDRNGDFSPVSLRLAVNALIPKQET